MLPSMGAWFMAECDAMNSSWSCMCAWLDDHQQTCSRGMQARDVLSSYRSEIDDHHAMATSNGGFCASPIPDVVLLPPFLIPDLPVFFSALLSFRN